MKKIFSLFLFLSFSILSAQNIFDYEKEISSIEKYIAKEITFDNLDEKIKLSGTLITPKTEFEKIIVIATGTGPHSRHAHNFLTESLLENGFAVFRFDKRGIGKSEGKSTNEVSSYIEDLTFIISKLDDNNNVNNKKIGLIGHSLGGLAAIGAIENTSKIDFLIQWSTPVGNFGDFIKYQFRSRNNDEDLRKLFKVKDVEKIWDLLSLIQSTVYDNLDKDYIGIYNSVEKKAKEKGYKEKQIRKFLVNPNNMDLMKYNFDNTYINSTIPILFIIGSEDSLIEANKSIEIINSYGNNNIEPILFEGLNHFLTNSGKVTKMTNELYQMDKIALEKIIKWIKEK